MSPRLAAGTAHTHRRPARAPLCEFVSWAVAQFTQGHFEYESNEEDHLKDWDVILIGKYTIGIKDVFEAWELSKQYDHKRPSVGTTTQTVHGSKPVMTAQRGS